ncbi:Calcium-binding protein [Venturia nashicola]|nr:Calcium-binding protein [Venturia nashicola]
MKVSSAFSFILPLVSLSALASPLALHETSLNPRAILTSRRYQQSFISAIDFNICNLKFGGGVGGFGHVSLITKTGRCIDYWTMKIGCQYTHPTTYAFLNWYTCGDKLLCMPTTKEGGPMDAGCLPVFQPSGVLGEGDIDNFACSAGFNVGDRDLNVRSSVTTDGQSPGPAIARCTIHSQDTGRKSTTIWDHSPCETQSTILHLYAHTTYQACISAAVGFIHHRVGFKWHILPPIPYAKVPRDLEHGTEEGTPSSELFTIDDTQSSVVNLEVVVEK